ncbi:MAG: copper amine oxidase N-terminal domain-containing protein [Syntrophomonadaceae bacterium]
MRKCLRVLCFLAAITILASISPFTSQASTPYTHITLVDSSGEPEIMYILYDPVANPQMAGYKNAQPYLVEPIWESGHYLIPLGQIAGILKFKVNFNANTSEITLTDDNNAIILTLNSNTAFVNGVKNSLDTAPRSINGRTMVPVGFVSQNLGYFVTFDEGYISISDCAFISRDEMTQMLRDKTGWTAPSPGTLCQTALPGTLTQKGIGVGDSIDKVISVYGKPSRNFVKNALFTGAIKYYDNFHFQGNNESLEFVFKNGIVTQMVLNYE